MRRVLDAHGQWQPIGSILPPPPDPTDPRGITTPFHGRYRGAHNTGVPDRSALGTPRLGGVLITPNQTYNDQHFIGNVEVRAAGIVFNRCYFESRGELFLFSAVEQTAMYDCDFNGGNASSTSAVVTGSVMAVRCHIWGGGQDSVGFGDDGAYEDCYIHGNVPHFGTHSDSAQTLGGTNLAVRRCKLLALDPVTGSTDGYNAAMQLGIVSGGSPLAGLDVIDNYVDGGGFTLNGSLLLPEVSGVTMSGNRWGRSGQFGPIAAADRVVPPYGTFTNTNVFDDTGAPV